MWCGWRTPLRGISLAEVGARGFQGHVAEQWLMGSNSWDVSMGTHPSASPPHSFEGKDQSLGSIWGPWLPPRDCTCRCIASTFVGGNATVKGGEPQWIPSSWGICSNLLWETERELFSPTRPKAQWVPNPSWNPQSCHLPTSQSPLANIPIVATSRTPFFLALSPHCLKYSNHFCQTLLSPHPFYLLRLFLSLSASPEQESFSLYITNLSATTFLLSFYTSPVL